MAMGFAFQTAHQINQVLEMAMVKAHRFSHRTIVALPQTAALIRK